MIFAAASSATAGWSGAALFVQHTEGALAALGNTGRRRAVSGPTINSLAPASPHFIGRANRIEIVLAGEGLAIEAASFGRLGQGANRALIGQELIQSGSVSWTAPDRMLLKDLLRGRGGTEWAIATNAPGGTFVHVDDGLLPLDATTIGDASSTLTVATGLGDETPVPTAIEARGSTRRPLTPVHGRARRMPGGSISLSWARRARGAFMWPDSVDAPLSEQTESYQMVIDDSASETMRWIVGTPGLTIEPLIVASLHADAVFKVTQLDNSAASLALFNPCAGLRQKIRSPRK